MPHKSSPGACQNSEPPRRERIRIKLDHLRPVEGKREGVPRVHGDGEGDSRRYRLCPSKVANGIGGMLPEGVRLGASQRTPSSGGVSRDPPEYVQYAEDVGEAEPRRPKLQLREAVEVDGLSVCEELPLEAALHERVDEGPWLVVGRGLVTVACSKWAV